MEYVQSLYSWFSVQSQGTAADESSSSQQQSTHPPPPDFLSLVRRSRRSQLGRATPTGGREEPLTPLELRLRELVVDLYSDAASTKTAVSESEDLSEIDSGHFSDRPATSLSEPHLRFPSPLAMATTEPRERTPLRSYTDTALPNEQEPPPLLLSFSADDIAEVGHDPSLPSLSATSNFQFGLHTPMAGAGNLPPLPPSPYGVRSPPPASLPLYSYTEPSLSIPPSPKKPQSADLHSLVSRSFQLPSQPNPTKVVTKSSVALATSSSVLATPPESQATPTEQRDMHPEATPPELQDTPPNSQSTGAQSITPGDDGKDRVSSDAVTPGDDGKDGVSSDAVTPIEKESIDGDSPDFTQSQQDESSGVKIWRDRPQSYGTCEENKTLPYNPGGGLLDVETPLSPKEVRDRLADVVQGKPPLGSAIIALSTSAPHGELLGLSVDGVGEREGEDGGKEGGGEGDEPSEQVELREGDVLELHNFEEAETSSVVSIEQITEALRHEPLSLPPPSTSLHDREKTQTHDSSSHAFPLPLSSSPLPAGKTAPLPSKYSKSVGTPPPARMPQHLRPAHRQYQQTPRSDSHKQQSSPAKQRTSPFLPPPSSMSPDRQLSEVLHTKAHLEGQLEAVTEECRELLKERAALNSKLAVTEAELEVARRERKSSGTAGPNQRTAEDSARLRQQLETFQRDLREERKTLDAVRDNLNRVKASEQRLKSEVEEGQEKGAVLECKVRELGEQLKDSERESEEEKASREAAQHQLRSLQSSYQAVEESKGWMQAQLEETLEEKLKLQEELRTSKAESIASTVKMDQLARENASFLQQITNLQRGVLKDKARLVSELESIEADVLSREDSYARLVAEKSQLEELAQQRAEEIERLSAEVGRTTVERDELRARETERASREEGLVGQCQLLQTSKREAGRRIQDMERELAAREEEVDKLRRGKNGLQERLREAEAALVGKDGALRGIKDSQQILKQELEMSRRVQGRVERELEDERRNVARLESSLAASRDGSSGNEYLVKSLQESQQQLEAENRVLHERVAERETEVREKERELEVAQSRNKDTTTRLGDTERKLDTATRECDTLKRSLDEREGTVRRLTQESEGTRLELENVKSDRDHLQSRLHTVLQQKSRLEGQLSEQSTLGGELEQLQVAVRERSSLRKELETVKLAHQTELAQFAAKQGEMETELRTARRETERAQSQLQKVVASSEETAAKLSQLKAHMKRELDEAKREVGRERRGREEAERGATGLRMELEEARKQCDWLGKEVGEMRGTLAHESTQKGEVERASGMVALRLKQNAEEKEKELREENQTLSLELEQVRGRLAGILVTQQALKTHACQLESALAERGSSLTRLTAEVERLEREKQTREGQVHSQTASLSEELSSLQNQLVEAHEQLCGEESRANELTEELSKRSRELSKMRSDHSTDEKTLPVLEAKVSRLTQRQDELRLELSTTRAELVVAKTAVEAAERELEERKTQVEILETRLSASEEQSRERERDVEELRSRLQAVEEGGREGERRALFETSLSSIGGDEDTDNATAAPHGELEHSIIHTPTHSLHENEKRYVATHVSC